jgi:hypothetical protein
LSREAQSKIQHPNLKIFASTLLIACPGLTQEMLDYKIQVIREFVRSNISDIEN